MKAPALSVLLLCALALQTGGISRGGRAVLFPEQVNPSEAEEVGRCRYDCRACSAPERLFASGLEGPSIARSLDGAASRGGVEFRDRWPRSPPRPQLRGGGPSRPAERLQCGGCPRRIGAESARQALRGGGRSNEKLVMEAFPKDVGGMLDPLKGEVPAPPRP